MPAGFCCLEFLGFRELSHELLPIKTLRLVGTHSKGRRPAGPPLLQLVFFPLRLSQSSEGGSQPWAEARHNQGRLWSPQAARRT